MIKRLDLIQKTFTANGNKYTILESIPLSRYKVYQRLMPKLGYGATFEDIFKGLKKAYEHLNNKAFADSAVTIHNIMSGIKDVQDDERNDPALLMCSLFVVRDGEDVGVYDENLANEKIKDWAKEGYEVNGFFQLALISIGGFKKIFSEFTQSL